MDGPDFQSPPEMAAPRTELARAAVLNVVATVVRQPAPPVIRVRGGVLVMSNPCACELSVEGGTLRRQRDGTMRVVPLTGVTTTVTVTY